MSRCVGICDLNFLDEDHLAGRRASSEKVAYPADNAYNLQRRSMVWRSGGNFEIRDGENTLVFRESLGVDLTATIEPGFYESVTLFLAALKTALEAAGVATYTCDTDGGRIRITSNLGGGATIFQLRMEAAGSADMAVIMGFDTVAFTGDDSYTADVLRIHTDEWLEFDLGFPGNPHAFVLASARNEPLKLTGEAVVKLQANWTNNFTVTPALEIEIPYDQFVLAEWDLENGLAGAGSPGYRYWRAQIVDPANTREFVEFGLVFLGRCIVPERGCAVFPLDNQGEDSSVVNYAEAGQGFAQELPATETIGLDWDALNKEEKADLKDHWEAVKKVRAFFVILDSATQEDGTGAFSVNQREWVKLVKFVDAPRFPLTHANYFQSTWNLREEL